MVSSRPVTDGWMAASVPGTPPGRAYIEPSQVALWGHPDYDEPIALYDERGRRIGTWERCGPALSGQDPPPCTPTSMSQ